MAGHVVVRVVQPLVVISQPLDGAVGLGPFAGTRGESRGKTLGGTPRFQHLRQSMGHGYSPGDGSFPPPRNVHERAGISNGQVTRD